MAGESAISAISNASNTGSSSSGKELTPEDLLKFVMGSIVLREVMTDAFKSKNDDKNVAAAIGTTVALMFTQSA